MVLLYWNMSKAVREEIIKSKRAKYGERIVQSLTAQLIPRYGRGFSKRNLWNMIKLYDKYPILQSLLGEFKGLSWTHIINLLPITDDLKHEFYATLCQKERWSTRTSRHLFLSRKRISAYLHF